MNKLIYTIMTTVLLLASCKKDDAVEVSPTTDGAPIGFMSSLRDMDMGTRASGALHENGYTDFCVWMQKDMGAVDPSDDDSPNLILPVMSPYVVSYSNIYDNGTSLADRHWGYSKARGQQTQYWDLDAESYTCLAYTVQPWEMDARITYSATEGLQHIHCNNGNTANHRDEILVAAYRRDIKNPSNSKNLLLGDRGVDTECASATAAVPLSFSHTMASVEFRIYQEQQGSSLGGGVPDANQNRLSFRDYICRVNNCGLTSILAVGTDGSISVMPQTMLQAPKHLGAGDGGLQPVSSGFVYSGEIPKCTNDVRLEQSLRLTPESGVAMAPQKIEHGTVFSVSLNIGNFHEDRYVHIDATNENPIEWKSGYKYIYYLVLPENYDDRSYIKIVLEVEPWVDSKVAFNDVQGNW